MSFNIFGCGATIVISIIMCDIGKTYLAEHQKKAVSTISGICDGVAGFGGILASLVLGPVQDSAGWTASFTMFSAAAICSCLPTIPYTVTELKAFCSKRKQTVKYIDENEQK